MTLRIATWNIFFGKELSTILQTLKTQTDFSAIDIFALQEASVHGGVPDAQVIAQTLGKEYDFYQTTAQVRKNMPQANALVWNTKRIQVNATQTIFLPNFSDVPINNVEKTIKLFAKKEKRNAVMIQGTMGKKSFRMYSAHFDVLGFHLKTAQLLHLFHDTQKQGKVDFSCIAGDLNTFNILKRPRWHALKKIAEEHDFLDITSHISWTFYRKVFRWRQKTDAIFLKQTNLLSYSSWSNNSKGSDHIPVFAIITL